MPKFLKKTFPSTSLKIIDMDRSIKVSGQLKFIFINDNFVQIVFPFVELFKIRNHSQYNLLCTHSLFSTVENTRKITALKFFAILDDPRYKNSELSTIII